MISSVAVLGRSIHNYVVKLKIGEGGMGAVYLAEHPKISRRVAIKVLLPQLSKDPAQMPFPPYMPLGPYNDCMHTELKRAIKQLEAVK
jgi:serine/threonine protein kinase